jgi:hypothetical protein
MEDLELKKIWESYDRKIEESRILNLQSWAVNFQALELIQQHKAEKALNALAGFKIRAVIFGFIWTFLLGVLVYGNQLKNLYFTLSVSILFFFNIAALIIYIRQIVMIKQINYSNSITDTQKQLSTLESSTVGLRFLWLQTPFYSTFFWSSTWISFSSLKFWLIPFPIALFFTILGIFLYRMSTPENMHKKWVRKLMMAGPEYKSVVKAKEFMAEIDTFQKELV